MFEFFDDIFDMDHDGRLDAWMHCRIHSGLAVMGIHGMTEMHREVIVTTEPEA